MRQVLDGEIKKRLAFDNPWWESGTIDGERKTWPRRAYFDGLLRLITATDVRRAVVLMGPRRVGKTVLIHHIIQKLLDDGIPATSILYVSVETPVYTGMALEKLLHLFQEIHGHGRDAVLYIFYDEIQYLKDWEIHLKSLVDSYPAIRFAVSGSAAAALRMKSRESGAGRFTDFILPPLLFSEFLRFTKREALMETETYNINALNEAFVEYVNYGGFPEVVMNENIRKSMDRFVAEDIIDKVLLRDLPSLYGINDPQELRRLFVTLAYNTGSEVNVDKLAQSSGISRNTLLRYLDYLEAAFLVRRLHRIDQNARRLKVQSNFKVYLTNPCLRAAMFGPVGADDDAMGAMAETALLSQMAHAGEWMKNTYYARWKDGEIDIVSLDASTLRPNFITEIKWSDRVVATMAAELKGLISFSRKNSVERVRVTTRSHSEIRTIDGQQIIFSPTAEFCAEIGFGVIEWALQDGFHPFTEDRLSNI